MIQRAIVRYIYGLLVIIIYQMKIIHENYFQKK